MTTEIEQDALAGLYEVRDAARVRAWLAEYPFLVPILRQTRPEIARLFPDAPVTLAVTDDPEEAAGTELLAWIGARDGDTASRLAREEALDDFLFGESYNTAQTVVPFRLNPCKAVFTGRSALRSHWRYCVAPRSL